MLTTLATIIGIGAVLAALLFVPIFKPRGRMSKLRGEFKITPEIEKARKITQTRLGKGRE